MHNFIAYFRKGGDFLKSYWAKWPRKQVAFFHGGTVKGAESNIFTCKPHSIFKPLKLIRLSRILSCTNHESGIFQSSHVQTAWQYNSQKGPDHMSRGSNGHEQCVTRYPVSHLVHSLGRPTWVITWKISTWDRGITILGSRLTGLARCSFNRFFAFS